MIQLSNNEMTTICSGGRLEDLADRWNNLSWGCQLAWAALGLSYIGLFTVSGGMLGAAASVIGLNLSPIGIALSC